MLMLSSVFTGHVCVGSRCLSAAAVEREGTRVRAEPVWRGLLDAHRSTTVSGVRGCPKVAARVCTLNYSQPRACPSRTTRRFVEPCISPPHARHGSCAGGNGEEQTALHFLSHTTGVPVLRNGTFLELGANDGHNSNTRNLEHCLGWRGILIEGQPVNFARLQRNRPGALSVAFAICETHGTVQFTRRAGVTSGMPAHMPHGMKRR